MSSKEGFLGQTVPAAQTPNDSRRQSDGTEFWSPWYLLPSTHTHTHTRKEKEKRAGPRFPDHVPRKFEREVMSGLHSVLERESRPLCGARFA